LAASAAYLGMAEMEEQGMGAEVKLADRYY
jgi:hypothetical protein